MKDPTDNIANDCVAELERRESNQAIWDSIYNCEFKEYLENIDWQDVADQNPEQIQVILQMIYKEKFGLAKFFLHEVILKRAADFYASREADRRFEN